MIKAERQDRVRELVASQGTVTVREIVSRLGVSDMTVRRDLEELAQAGELERVHGGARCVEPHRDSVLMKEFTHDEKRSQHVPEKSQIARLAASLIKPGETVFLGTGTTIERMVPFLPRGDLRVITNSLSVFNLLSERQSGGLSLVLIGGTYRSHTGAFVGPLAEEGVGRLGIGTAFIGANGILGDSVSTSNMEEGNLQRIAFDKADRRILVVDSSKFDHRDFYSFYRVSELDAIVCEPGSDSEKTSKFSELTKIIC